MTRRRDNKVFNKFTTALASARKEANRHPPAHPPLDRAARYFIPYLPARDPFVNFYCRHPDGTHNGPQRAMVHRVISGITGKPPSRVLAFRRERFTGRHRVGSSQSGKHSGKSRISHNLAPTHVVDGGVGDGGGGRGGGRGLPVAARAPRNCFSTLPVWRRPQKGNRDASAEIFPVLPRGGFTLRRI